MSGVRISKGARKAIKSGRRAVKGSVQDREMFVAEREQQRILRAVKREVR